MDEEFDLNKMSDFDYGKWTRHNPSRTQLLRIVEAASWLEQVHRLFCAYRPGVWIDESIIWMEWAEEDEDPEVIMEKIREQRAAHELERTTLQAWEDLQAALRNVNMEAKDE